jgi:hypothetical protein
MHPQSSDLRLCRLSHSAQFSLHTPLLLGVPCAKDLALWSSLTDHSHQPVHLVILSLVMELTAQQLSVLNRLQTSGYEVVAFPMYESYVGVRRGNCGALLAPSGSDGFTLYGEPSYLVAGGLSARTIQSDGHWFVRKKDKLEASPERTAELEFFAAELVNALLPVA